jgi:short-subunit dehydrogenase
MGSIGSLSKDAGYFLHGDFYEMPIERTVDMIQLNITTLTELTYFFARDMATRRSGHILLVASLLAFQAVPGYAAYAATKRLCAPPSRDGDGNYWRDSASLPFSERCPL